MTLPTRPSPILLDGATLLAQLRQLGDIGRHPEGGGRTRLALTDADKAARDQLVAWMRELDLDVQIDQVGNIFGTLQPADSSRRRPALMIGSHIDTVRHAGALDGCYGVLAGLAVARAYTRAGVRPARPITIAAFTNEEGVRYQPDMMGSLVYAGGLAVDAALATVGLDGSLLGAELARIGYAGAMPPGSIVPYAYLELHVEQGPILEAAGVQIGVVDRLQGISWQRITIEGQANHAGTTPMRLRHDAGWAAARINVWLREFATMSTTTLATIGTLTLEPNVINVIPGTAVLTVDLRDPDAQCLDTAERRLADFLTTVARQEGVTIRAEQLVRFAPVIFNGDLADDIACAADQCGFSSLRMTSGAGHDAQMIARLAPAAMIFVPSKGGISHNPLEHTEDDQLLAGAQVLLQVTQHRLAADSRTAEEPLYVDA